MKKYFTIEKSKLKTIWKIAWPLIIANSFWNLQLTIDRIFLGNFSTESLGAAMAVMGVFWVPMALLQQTSSYVTTFVAQYFGAKQEEKIGESFWQAIYISIIGGVLFLVLNYFSGSFFALVGHSDRLQTLEVDYFNALGFTALPTALVAAISGFFTGLGDSKKVIGINFVGLIFNIVLDYILIFGNFGFDSYGISGAGYATAIATYFAALYGIIVLIKSKSIKKYALKSAWAWNKNLMSKFLKYGLPSGFQWALEGMAFTVFLIIMGRLKDGEAALSSSSIAVTVMMLAVLPSMGIAQAVLTIVGQKIGEKKPHEAVEYTWGGVKLSFIYILLVAMTFWLIPDFYLSWFRNDSNQLLWEQVSLLAPKLLAIVGVFTIFDSVYFNLSFALKGAGDTKFVSIVALIVPWPLMVLPAYLFMDMPNAAVLSWQFTILYVFILTTILLFRFKSGKWMSMSITD